MARRAMDRMRDGRWEEAQRLLAQAYEVIPAPSIAVLEGDALMEMGALTRAKARFEAAVRTDIGPDSPAAYRKAVEIAKDRLRVLEARMPKLVLVVENVEPKEETLHLSVNDEPMSPELLGIERSVDPGRYVVKADLGGKTVEQSFELEEGDRRRIALSGNVADPLMALQSDRSETSEQRARARRRAAGWVSLGVGGAGLTTGVVAGILTQKREDRLSERCNPACPRRLADDVDAMERAQTTSWIGYGVGLAGAATGAVLLLTSQEPSETEPRPEVRPYATLRTVGLEGRF